MKSSTRRAVVLGAAVCSLTLFSWKTLGATGGVKAVFPLSLSPGIFLTAMAAGCAVLVLVSVLFFREVARIEHLVGVLSGTADGEAGGVPADAAVTTPGASAREKHLLERLTCLPRPDTAAWAEAAAPRRGNRLGVDKDALAALSHDIRTPMNAVLGMSELLLAEPLDERQRGYVLDIRAAARSILVLDRDAEDTRADARAKGNPAGEQLQAPPPGVKVLVVDDNAVNLRVAQGLLRIEGICCETADSGRDALRKVEAQDFSLVFMDHMMPDMDGLETTRRIRMMPLTKGDIPIVALTATVGDGAREMYRRVGMNDFIPKPIQKEELRRVLARWLPPGRDAGFPDPRRAAPPAIPPENPGPVTEWLARAREIDGLDVGIGLRISGNWPDAYGGFLRSAAGALPAGIDSLRLSVGEGDLRGIATGVRSLKSWLAAMGASTLANQATVLESECFRSGGNPLKGGMAQTFLDDLQVFADKLRLIF